MKSKIFWKPVIGIIVLLSGSFAVFSQTNVVLAIDSSKSMEKNDGSGYRFSSSASFMNYFSFLGHTKAGIVSFGNSAEKIRPFDSLSSDELGSYENDLRKIEEEEKKTSRTEIGKGLLLSLEMIGRTDGGKNIILVSDGNLEGDEKSRRVTTSAEANRLAEEELWREIVPKLKENGIKVFTAGLLGKSNSGEKLLKRLAEETGGFYSPVTDAREFSNIFARIRDKIDAPSASEDIPPQSQSFGVSAEIAKIIIEGNQEFQVIAPDGFTYPTTDRSATFFNFSEVDQSKGTFKLYIKTKESGSLAGTWTLKRSGEIKIIRIPYAQLSEVENNEREIYFLGEVVLMSYAPKILDDKLVKKDDLSSCRVNYEINRIERDTGPENFARGALIYSKDKRIFLGESESELKKTGDYEIKTDLVCRDQATIAQSSHNFHVVDGIFTKIEVYDENNKLIDNPEISPQTKIYITGGFDDAALKRVNNTTFTFTTSKSRTMSIVSTGKKEFKKDYQAANGALKSDLLSFEEGENPLRIDIDGDIFVQRKKDAQADRFPIKIRTAKTIKVSSPIIPPDWWKKAKEYGIYAGGFIAGLLVVYRTYRTVRPPERRVREFEKGGFRYPKDRREKVTPLENPHARFFSNDLKASVGFEDSDADVKIQQEGEGVFMDVVMNSRGEYYLIPREGFKIIMNEAEPVEEKTPVLNNSILQIWDEIAEFGTKLEMLVEDDIGKEEHRY